MQVEHTVTEEVYGVDLVRAQIDLARGRSIDEVEPNPRGWAFEARVCAEDAHNNFMPAPESWFVSFSHLDPVCASIPVSTKAT